LSAPKSSGNPADLRLDGRLYETRLAVPSIPVKLSDPISGMTKYSAFSFSLDNSDGRFDGGSSQDYFNSPAYIRKAVIDNPAYDDFIPVRAGMVEHITISADRIEIQCADKFRALDDPVCKPIRPADYPFPEGFTGCQYKDGLDGKALPVVFGSGMAVPLIELIEPDYKEHEGYLVDGSAADSKEDDTVTLKGLYLAGEGVGNIEYTRITPEFWSHVVHGEKDDEDVIIPCSFDPDTGIIAVDYTQKLYTLTGMDSSGKPVYQKKEKTPKPKWVKASGYSGNTIGQIVTALVARNEYLQYNESNWDMPETNDYISISPAINIVITGGDIKKAVADTLKNDMAFLIQKNDGRLTLRRWGTGGVQHTLESWRLTQQPQKNFQEAQEHYFSTCVINYQYNEQKKERENRYRYVEREAEAVWRYLKKKEKTFDTHLTDAQQAEDLAERLGSRFCELKDTVRVGVGADTSVFSLLDVVQMRISVNGREYSDNETWIIRELDPAQDILVLEEL
jgi:hypothetical protein